MMKEYRIAKGWALFIYLTAPLLMALFIMILVGPLITGIEEEMPKAAYFFLAALSIGMLTMLVFAIVDTAKGKFVISEDRIYRKGVFSTRSLRLNEIKGFRVDPRYITIEPVGKGKKKIKINEYVAGREEIIEWLYTRYPDLNSVQEKQEEAEILADDTYGRNEEEREEKLHQARKTARLLNWLGGIIAAWIMFWPRPYELAVVVAIAFPVIAVAILKSARGLIRLNGEDRSAYPNIFGALLFPVCGLLLRVLLDFTLLSYSRIWGPAIVISLIFIGIILFKNKEFSFRKASDLLVIVFIALSFFAYGYGAVVALNCAFDRSGALAFDSTIIDKRISSTRTTTYHLEVEAWGPRQEVNELTVSKALYQQVQEGDTVTIYLKEGWLGMRWFFVGS